MHTGRRSLIAAAALAVTGVAVGGILLSPRPPTTGATSPSPSSAESATSSAVGSASPSWVGSARPSSPGPSTAGRRGEPLGAPNDAVLIRLVGDQQRPDAIEVSLVTLDTRGFEAKLEPRVIASLPGSAIPEGLMLAATAPKYGQDGWLALGASDKAASRPSILVFDLRAPDKPPWLVSGRIGSASWGPGVQLAVSGRPSIELHDLSSCSRQPMSLAPEIVLGDTTEEGPVAPTWLADGSGFLAWHGGSQRQLGKVDLDGRFEALDNPPAVFQSTGRERRWSAAGTETAIGCPTEGGPPGCDVVSGVNGGEAEVWYSETSGGGTIQDYAWDAEGDGLWFLLERVTGEGPLAHDVVHFDIPGQPTEVASMSLEAAGDRSFEIQGIGDAASNLDGRHVLIGPKGSTVQVAVSGDGGIATFQDGAWFAGWAADQGPYPAR